MRRPFLVIALVVGSLLGGCSLCTETVPPWPHVGGSRLVDNAAPLQSTSVVVEVSNGSLRQWGTGFCKWKGNRLYIWTAAHVVSDDHGGWLGTISIYRPGDHPFTRDGAVKLEAKLVAVPKGYGYYDVALLEAINPPSTYPVGSVKFWLDDTLPTTGSPVLSVGNYDGWSYPLSVDYGAVSYVGRLHEGEVLDQLTVLCYGGASGGPVFSAEDGRVIGLMVRSLCPKRITWMVPVRQIRQFAKAYQVEFALED